MNFRPPCLGFSTLLLIVALTLAGCATPSNNPQAEAAEAEDFNDPLEDTNRAIFDFNQVVDRNVLVPVAKAYRTVLPDPVRDSLRDFLRNRRGRPYRCRRAVGGASLSRGRSRPHLRRLGDSRRALPRHTGSRSLYPARPHGPSRRGVR